MDQPCEVCGGSGEIRYFKGHSRFLLSGRVCPLCDGLGAVLLGEPPGLAGLRSGEDREEEEKVTMIELLQQRRSARRFTAEPVSEGDRRTLEEAALRSPSSRGLNPWQFVWVDNPGTIGSLAEAKAHGAAFLRGAPLAVAVCADEDIADTWVEDASIASILLQLAAQSRGLGSCWIQIRLRQRPDGADAEGYVRRHLGIPDGLRVLSVIAIGHPAEDKPGHDAETLDWSKVHRNRFGG